MTSARTSFDFSEIKSIVLPYSVQNLYQRQHMFYLRLQYYYYTHSVEKAFTGFLGTSEPRTLSRVKKKTDRFNSSKKTCGVGSETLVNLPENCAIITLLAKCPRSYFSSDPCCPVQIITFFSFLNLILNMNYYNESFNLIILYIF